MELLELLQEALEFAPPQYAYVNEALQTYLPYLLLAVAGVTCFFGYRIHRIWNACLFFTIGFLVGALSGIFFPATISIWVFIGAGAVLGSLAAWQSHRLHWLQLFIFNAFMVFAALPDLLTTFLPRTAALLIGLAAAIVVGLLAAKYKYIVTILTTSIHGALNASLLLWQMLRTDSFWLVMGTALVLAVAGLVVQFRMNSRLEHKREPAAG